MNHRRSIQPKKLFTSPAAFYLATLLTTLVLPTSPLQADTPRRELARHAFNFLFSHAKRDDFDPSQYYCNVDPYSLHLTAKRLYDPRYPLKRITPPDSVFERGCYQPYSIKVWFEHDLLITEIRQLIDDAE